MKAKGVAIAVCCLGLLGGLFAKMYFEVPSDQALIEEALREATKNGKEGKPGGVLDYLSGDFRVGEFAPTSGDVADFVKNQKPEVTILDPKPIIRGDLAEITSSVSIKFGVGNIGTTQTVDNVRVVLRRETGLKFGIFPAPRWKIVEVSAKDAALGNPFGT